MTCGGHEHSLIRIKIDENLDQIHILSSLQQPPCIVSSKNIPVRLLYIKWSSYRSALKIMGHSDWIFNRKDLVVYFIAGCLSDLNLTERWVQVAEIWNAIKASMHCQRWLIINCGYSWQLVLSQAPKPSSSGFMSVGEPGYLKRTRPETVCIMCKHCY